MRLTAHNGRTGKHGTYSAKHNDRNFDARKADHIDTDRSAGNAYYCIYKDMTFEDAEALFYEKHFRGMLDARNDRYMEQRHPERCRTMDDYRTASKTCPEETILQVGHKDETIDPKLLWNICADYINWEMQRYPNIKVLNVALHVDEQGAPHMHERRVWLAHDEQGRETVGQAQALREMGIQAPNPDKPYGKYNNAKMTYTQECREKLFEIAKQHGLDLEREPREHSKSGLALEEYKAQQEQEKARQAQEQVRQAQEQVRQAQEQIQSMQAELTRMASERDEVIESTRKAEKALKTAQNALKQVDAKQGELDAVNAELKAARRELKTTLDLKARASEIHKVFGDRETQTYHKNMLESTREIGTKAYMHMMQASSTLQEIAKRETAIQKKEQEIEPLHQAAAKDRQQAQEYLQEQESYILSTAENKAQQKFDDFIQQEFGQELKGRSARLERFVDSLTLKDGRTVLDAFNEQEHKRQQRLAQSWDIER